MTPEVRSVNTTKNGPEHVIRSGIGQRDGTSMGVEHSVVSQPGRLEGQRTEVNGEGTQGPGRCRQPLQVGDRRTAEVHRVDPVGHTRPESARRRDLEIQHELPGIAERIGRADRRGRRSRRAGWPTTTGMATTTTAPSRRWPRLVDGCGLERNGDVDHIGRLQGRRRSRVGHGRGLVGPDVQGRARRDDETALVGQEALGIGPLADGRAPREQGDGLGRTAVVGQSAQPRRCDPDLIMAGAVRESAGAAGADQVPGGFAGNMPAISSATALLPVPLVFSATMVLINVTLPAATFRPPPEPPTTTLPATVLLYRLTVPPLT